jgi:hypothetical protein
MPEPIFITILVSVYSTLFGIVIIDYSINCRNDRRQLSEIHTDTAVLRDKLYNIENKLIEKKLI